jgi:prepilin peptidase CpaA
VEAPHAYQLATLGVVSLAAAFDWRTGRIPNWLTLGAIVAAFPLHAWLAPANHTAIQAMQWCLFGAVACALPTVLGFWLGWIAGGDVKLIAAMGAVSGLSLGLESVFLAFLCAVSFLVLRLAWTGTFFQTVGDQVTLTVGRRLRRGARGKASAAPLVDEVNEAAPHSTLRFGPFALTGAALSLVLHGGFA